MDDENETATGGTVEEFSNMVKALGKAMSEAFNDPELREKARDLGDSAAASARTMRARYEDEEVRAKFRDLGEAARRFGQSVAEMFHDHRQP